VSFWALVIVLTVQAGMIVWHQIRMWQYESFMDAQIRIDQAIIETLKSAELLDGGEPPERGRGPNVQ